MILVEQVSSVQIQKMIFGDSGYNGTLEARTPIWVGGDGASSAVVKIFTDFGHIRVRESSPGAQASEDISSVGGGILFAISDVASVDLDLAYPLNKTAGSRSGTLQIALQLRYLLNQCTLQRIAA